jgi:2-amino-4-hydroxy-6-hydroxymethyldihydropteridine diphosphokinase
VTAAYVGLGSNLEDPRAQVRRALDELAAVSSTKVTARSHLYRSPPLGPADQPDYINAAAALDTTLRELESRHGRRRDGTRWGPRSLDLDLLLYGDVLLDTPELTLPHPGLPERAFVLYPLYDIAPLLVVPGKGTVTELRARLGSPKIARLEPQEP